jgi:MinD-like ATPase involved in chromosome partitioning or flagellar assembly
MVSEVVEEHAENVEILVSGVDILDVANFERSAYEVSLDGLTQDHLASSEHAPPASIRGNLGAH